MRVGVIADLHGNWSAYQSVREELARLGADRIVCLGDLVDPLPASERVFDDLHAAKIPMIRGNHEDYVVRAATDAGDVIHSNPRFLPVVKLARSMRAESIARLAALPLTFKLEEAPEILFCHSSPSSNMKGWNGGISPELAEDYARTSETWIVSGHWHNPKSMAWRDKTLISAGSVGLPHSGKPAAEFVLLERASKGWTHEHRSVPYDHQVTLDEFKESGWLKVGGPMAWLYAFELATATRKIARFSPWLGQKHLDPKTLSELETVARRFFQETGGWEVVQSLID